MMQEFEEGAGSTGKEMLKEFQQSGLECRLMKLTYPSGNFHYCGYVKLERDLSIHECQNLTTRDVSFGPNKDNWVGFDTGHSGQKNWDEEKCENALKEFAEELTME